MANVLSNLLNRDDTTKKLQKEVKDMELKKQSLIMAVRGEIAEAQRKIDDELYQIGVGVYSEHLNGGDITDTLTAHYDNISSLKSIIDKRESKIKEIAARYDEEIGMLNAHLGVAQPNTDSGQSSATSGGGIFCEKCGKPYTPGVDMFCMGCGQKL